MILDYRKLEGLTGHEAGQMLLMQMYRQETGAELPEICRTDRGKPYFPGKKWHFSISHTKSHAFCALSRQNVAVDAEELDRQVNPKLAEKILSPGEMVQYQAALDKNKALLTFWVLKEAAAKLSGEGLRGYPCHTNFSLSDPRVREIEHCLVAVLEGESDAV